MFFLYTVFDEMELIAVEKPIQFEFDEADYVEDIEIMAPKQFEDHDIDGLEDIEMSMMEKDDDIDLKFGMMTMDDAIDMESKKHSGMTTEATAAHLDAALDIDRMIPLDESNILLEQGFNDDISDIPIDESHFNIELELEESANLDALARSGLSASQSGNQPMSRADSMAGTLTATVGRGKTMAKLTAELDKVQEEASSNGSGEDDMNATSSPKRTDEKSDDYTDDTIVERHLHNFSMYGYAMCFVYLALTALVTVLNTAGWSKSTLADFWWAMIFAAAASFFLLEPLLMALIWLYRWLIDEDDDPTVDMHPFEGEERFRFDA